MSRILRRFFTITLFAFLPYIAPCNAGPETLFPEYFLPGGNRYPSDTLTLCNEQLTYCTEMEMVDSD